MSGNHHAVDVSRKDRAQAADSADRIYVASQWALMRMRFQRHKLGQIGLVVLCILYAVAIFSPFLMLRPVGERSEYVLMAPTRLHFRDAEGRFHVRPFVYGVSSEIDLEVFERKFVQDTTETYKLRFFAPSEEYELWGIFTLSRRFIGVEDGGVFYPLGTDSLGRCMYSRIVSGSAISLSIGLTGVLVSFVLGCIFGGISGYRGGLADLIIQRIIEFMNGIPTIPLWMALSAAIPSTWPPLRVYWAITIILALAGWTGLARTIRGKLLQLREEDYVLAAQIAGASDGRIIARHMLPSFMSYLIVHITLAIPGMILGETSLSFLGLGLRPPTVSWGVLAQQAQNIRSVAENPWLMWPVAMVIITVFAFNFLGDALRDAADPYSVRK